MNTPASLHESLRDAALAVAGVARGRSLAAGFPAPAATGAARGALIDLVHGTLREYGRLPALTRALAKRPGTEARVEALLWCAIHALEDGRHAPYAVVDQAVRACLALGASGAKGFVNALLRRFLRERDALESAIAHDDEARWQHPRWWIESVRRTWPAQWQAVLAAGNAPPPMALRVNARRQGVDGYLARLRSAGMQASALGGHALVLERPVPVDRLPGFAEGEVSVQDAGAQRAAPLLDARDGMRVLDACAAPGGKCAHVLELAGVDLDAMDLDASRAARIESNLARLGLRARVRVGDCLRPESWWDGRPYDRVVADVPCSGSGVARRHPDIKWLRRPSDLQRFAERQGAILDALWRVLAPDGKLLYVTCSVFPEENDAVVEAFCRRTPNARQLPLPEGATQHVPPGPESDGFFFALLGRDR